MKNTPYRGTTFATLLSFLSVEDLRVLDKGKHHEKN